MRTARTSAAAAIVALALSASPAVAQTSATPSPRAPLSDEFQRADSDHDGKLSEDEARRGGFFSQESFAETDQDHDGKITLYELGVAVQGRFQGWIDRYTKADTDGDGSISRDEADRAGGEWSDVFTEVDRDGNGSLSRDEIMYRVTRGYYSETKTEPMYPNIIDKRF
ncbi:MAG TPA: EF-hand domain-containing protein [Candidatus Binatia bacterium]|nr:EF-hand domain-containing protein [Candidatus Binatia bacterium]